MKVTPTIADLALAGLMLTWAVCMFVYTYSFQPPPLPHLPGAALFPRFALAVVAIASVGIAVGVLVGKPHEAERAIELNLGRLVLVAGLGVCYGLALEWVGFEIATFATLAVGLTVCVRRPAYAIALSMAATLCLYGLFVLLLRVSAPVAFLPQYLSQIVSYRGRRRCFQISPSCCLKW